VGVGGASWWAGLALTVALTSKILIMSAMGVRPTTLDSRDIFSRDLRAQQQQLGTVRLHYNTTPPLTTIF